MIDMMEKIFKTGELYTEFLNALLNAAKASCDGCDHEARDSIYDKMNRRGLAFYEETFGRFLSTPVFGISRESLQQMMAATDAHNRFMAAMNDFLLKFNIPSKDAWEILIKTIKEREERGEGFKSAKEIYDFAVSIFEEKYDDHIKSPQGVRIVVDVVEKYVDFKKKSDVVRDIWFKSLSIPTSKEMDDVYKGIYDLRKKTRQQEARIRDHEALIENLNRKVLALETSLTTASKKG